MPNDRFVISQEKKVHVLKLSLPDGIDAMEIDTVIDGVLTGLSDKAKEKWITDLSDVTYMGSAMLGLMVNIRQRIRSAGGKLILCGMKPQLLKIFQTCCLERLFEITKTRADAIAQASR
ncbi:MAG: STAS domain-containing protein [Tepidisphaeraceae bacterium]|jgi:anti-anti-sigma factor